MPTSTGSNFSTEILRKLHRIHRQLTDLRQRRDRGPKQISIRQANVGHQEQQLAQVQAEAKACRVAADEKQLQFKAREGKIKELKGKLNAAASNREYQVLKDQIAADDMANSVLADEVLEALEKVDSFKAKIAGATAAVARSREELQRMEREVAQQLPLIDGDVQRLEMELKESEIALPVDIRDAYQRMVRQKGEEALAAVEGQVCGGCNQEVPINLCNAIRLNRPAFCKSCGRLLYLPE